MRNTFINPDPLFDPTDYGFSHVVSAPTGRTIYISGQGGEDRSGNLATSFDDQVRQAFANLKAALAAVDAAPGDVVKITTFIVDHNQSKLESLKLAIAATFAGPAPAQSLVPVPRLALHGMLFEVEAIAVLDQH